MFRPCYLTLRIPLDLSNTDVEVSTSYSETFKAAAYAQIQREIDALENEADIRPWKERHNGLSVIARLPPELLSDIFLLKALAEREESNNSRWIRVSHVCSHWRRIALGCPAFWSHIQCTHPTWAVEMLRRSRNMPLTVVATPRRYYTTSPAIRSVLGHLWRIRELSLLPDSSDLLHWEGLLANLKLPAPLLETLHIEFIIPHPKSKLPDGIFKNSPRLRHLTLRNCNLIWSTILPCALTTFQISNLHPRYQPSMDQLLTVLEKLPSLTTLTLSDAFKSHAAKNAMPIQKRVSLPSLKSLEVSTSLEACIFLLNHMDYPTTTKISVTCGVDAAESSSLLSDLGVLLKSRVERTRCAEMEEVSWHRIIIRAWNEPGTHRSPPIMAPNVSIAINSLDPVSPNVGILFDSLWSMFSMPDMKILHLDGIVDRPDGWLDMFGSLRSLDTIHVVLHATGLARALTGKRESHIAQDDQTRAVAFPALRHLVCENLMCPSWDDDDNTECCVLLKACLKERNEHYAPLHALHIYRTCALGASHCRPTAQHVQDLREVVGEVHWGGEDDDESLEGPPRCVK